ncbi:STAS domain-containing protein [Lacinutrix neustonica]|uniref:STAS domain-containing protein n=1 Tax=Lacinutrix neustonica TaxID=2980107 RepID=A0A9E8MU18_9FLAO|nr:STAS domain-containing protein [Lacinutrix neustonica]WAC01346.1 STAS domain-containing protein [Lacinutrix neustonica]
MALTITQQDNTITLEGSLNTANLNSFKSHFDFILNSYKDVTLDIDRVTQIDVSAMFVLKELYKEAALNCKIFFVSGYRSEEIYEDFQYINIA